MISGIICPECQHDRSNHTENGCICCQCGHPEVKGASERQKMICSRCGDLLFKVDSKDVCFKCEDEDEYKLSSGLAKKEYKSPQVVPLDVGRAVAEAALKWFDLEQHYEKLMKENEPPGKSPSVVESLGVKAVILIEAKKT